MPAAVIGGVIAGVGAIGASAISSSAQKKAAKTAAAAQQVAVDHQLEIANNQEKLVRDIYAQNQANFLPYQTAGYGALDQTQKLLGIKSMTADQYSKANLPQGTTTAATTQGGIDPATVQQQALVAIANGADVNAVRDRAAGLGVRLP